MRASCSASRISTLLRSPAICAGEPPRPAGRRPAVAQAQRAVGGAQIQEVQPLAPAQPVEQRDHRGRVVARQRQVQRMRVGHAERAGADLGLHTFEVALGDGQVGAHLGDQHAIEGLVAPPQQQQAEQRQYAQQGQQHHGQQLLADRQAGRQPGERAPPHGSALRPVGDAALQRPARDAQQLRGLGLVAVDRLRARPGCAASRACAGRSVLRWRWARGRRPAAVAAAGSGTAPTR